MGIICVAPLEIDVIVDVNWMPQRLLKNPNCQFRRLLHFAKQNTCLSFCSGLAFENTNLNLVILEKPGQPGKLLNAVNV